MSRSAHILSSAQTIKILSKQPKARRKFKEFKFKSELPLLTK
ncbi:hypothetical protein [uncultured Campylobacter sp.]|nr:hypothetical protein [uncultured Campylobacter sp.]